MKVERDDRTQTDKKVDRGKGRDPTRYKLGERRPEACLATRQRPEERVEEELQVRLESFLAHVL